MPQTQMNDDRFLFIDFETTGRDPVLHQVLEVGVVIADGELAELATYSHLVTPVGELNMTAEVFQMHVDSGMIAEFGMMTEPWYAADADAALAALVQAQGAVGAPLAGFSVHFDRDFVRKQFPQLYELLHYRIVDVSTIKTAYRSWVAGGEALEVFPGSGPVHRALPDARRALNEARALRNVFSAYNHASLAAAIAAQGLTPTG